MSEGWAQVASQSRGVMKAGILAIKSLSRGVGVGSLQLSAWLLSSSALFPSTGTPHS